MTLDIRQGFAPPDRNRVAALFWQAFQSKLSPILGQDTKALALIADTLQPEATVCAWSGDTLVGGMGFRTATQGFLAVGYRDLARTYGPVSAVWRGGLLNLFDQVVTPEQVLIDGLFVDPAWQSQGVGTALLDHQVRAARAMGKTKLVLDVVAENPRAVALYERCGFVPVRTRSMGPLRHLFGFTKIHRMEKQI